MTYDDLPPATPFSTSIEATIAQHGPLRVLRAAFGALIAFPPSRPPPPELSELDDHLRRDIGLPPQRASGPSLPLSPYLR